jgi:hypothetical protein
MIGGQLEQKFTRPPPQAIKAGYDSVSCYLSYSGCINRSITVQTGKGINARPLRTITKAKVAGGVAQEVPTMCQKLF